MLLGVVRHAGTAADACKQPKLLPSPRHSSKPLLCAFLFYVKVTS
jgi:hypothetical protein